VHGRSTTGLDNSQRYSVANPIGISSHNLSYVHMQNFQNHRNAVQDSRYSGTKGSIQNPPPKVPCKYTPESEDQVPVAERWK